jgi:hypothetical protein
MSEIKISEEQLKELRRLLGQEIQTNSEIQNTPEKITEKKINSIDELNLEKRVLAELELAEKKAKEKKSIVQITPPVMPETNSLKNSTVINSSEEKTDEKTQGIDELSSMLSEESKIKSILAKKIDTGAQSIFVSCEAEKMQIVLKALAERETKISKTTILLSRVGMDGFNLEKIKSIAEIQVIDSISKSLGGTPKKNYVFSDSMRDLTNMQIKLSDALQNKFSSIIIDSFDVFYLYHKENICTKFCYSLIAMARKYDAKIFIIGGKKSEKKLQQFFEQTISIEE